jgi:hypothetical protein
MLASFAETLKRGLPVGSQMQAPIFGYGGETDGETIIPSTRRTLPTGVRRQYDADETRQGSSQLVDRPPPFGLDSPAFAVATFSLMSAIIWRVMANLVGED